MAQELVETLKEKLGDKVKSIVEHPERRIFITIDPQDLIESTKIIVENMKGRFLIISGVDVPDGIEIVYHYSLDSGGEIVNLKAKISKSSPEIDSVSPIIRGAQWIEREVSDLLGVKFRGHPDMRRLIVSDDWPEGTYPLRRDYKG